MNTPRDDDETRDAHLLAALSHAPDADARPSAALTRAILDQARRASPPAPWRARLARLCEPAPMAAFATLAMATLIGVLWGGGRDLPEATPASRSPAPAEAPAVAAREALPAAAPASADAAPPPAAAATPPRKQRADDRPAERRRAAAPPPAPPAVAERAPEPSRDAARADEAKAAQPAALPHERSELASRALGAATATPAANDPWAGLRAALAQAGNQQVRWQRSSGAAELAHQAPQRDAWQALDAAARGHWQPVPQPAPLADTLRLTVGGELQGEIGWDMAAGAVLWRDTRSRWWRAAVGVEAARALQQRFDRW